MMLLSVPGPLQVAKTTPDGESVEILSSVKGVRQLCGVRRIALSGQ